MGTIFKITTWGESHGKAIGVVIDGCPAGIAIDEEEINQELRLRAPGRSPFISPRKEEDVAEILSGTFEGKTTGTPISIIIRNNDFQPKAYDPIKQLLRPGHANFTYKEKYGVFDYRGGGRSSGRETACRVAAGAIAKKFIRHKGIDLIAFLKKIGDKEVNTPENPLSLKQEIKNSVFFCPDSLNEKLFEKEILKTLEANDSIGGVVEFYAQVPLGLGDPVYEKLEANLAKALMGLPATKGFEIGLGFSASAMTGSIHNDLYYMNEQNVSLKSNHAGGTLGGISNGMPLVGRVAFKPASSIKKPQKTVSFQKTEEILELPVGSRHDPCIAIRAVPVVEAMVALVLADALLMDRCVRL